ncbi:MAG TPA: DEAD/DEAH box helicase [Verrucomicrobiae bacterium]|nr:DEAD/DEAH box helicase [Verrucomicrobiae bacterium]
MSKSGSHNGRASRVVSSTKYDAHHTVLSKTYGALADLRRELADSKSRVAEREEILRSFSVCGDPQRAWLLLEDYFEKLSLSRKDFTGTEWWPRLTSVQGTNRLEQLALLFLRANRPLPTELAPHADSDRLAQIEQAEAEARLVQQLEHWLFPPAPAHLDAPRAWLRVCCTVQPAPQHRGLFQLSVHFNLFRPRTGDKFRPLTEILELTQRSAHEQELFSPADWEFVQWLSDTYRGKAPNGETVYLAGLELLQWLAQWGQTDRLEIFSSNSASHPPHRGEDLLASSDTRPPKPGPGLKFLGQVAELVPMLEQNNGGLTFTHVVHLPDAKVTLANVKFFAGKPSLALVDNTFYLLRNNPPAALLEHWTEKPSLPIGKLSHRFRAQLRRSRTSDAVDWDQLCTTHRALPQFVFELNDDTVRLRLLARSERDQSRWHWTGQEWHPEQARHTNGNDKPEILEDSRLDAAVLWLRRLDWFTPEPGVWVGDAHEAFLSSLATAWPDKPKEAEYLGNPAFQRLFLAPRRLKPQLVVRGSGIDWFAVSAEWEMEGLKLTPADLERLKAATGRFVKLPDAGWLELDTQAVAEAHEVMADLGLDALSAEAQRINLEQGACLNEQTFQRFLDSPEAKSLRDRLSTFEGIPKIELPGSIKAEMRPYQKDGFDFLCHLSALKLGGILADDMGLGKTLQTLAWLAWMHERNGKHRQPALVICPASVLHNWRREAEKFTPQLKVLVMESGAARHSLRKTIPQYHLIVTNYALLRRDWEALQKFSFGAVILDEAQFIKNPTAQVTQSVKRLQASQRLALTGTPLENRLLDLWSIVDFVQSGYLGNQEHFSQTYEPKGEGGDGQLAQRIARRRLSAKLRPLMLRRLKRQVAKDLPERIEVRRDCELGEAQRKLYLAELRRTREQVLQAVAEKGLARSKIHVLAGLTRLRQICCHPSLVGNDSDSGKTQTLFELLEPLLADGQKVLVFSQFVQMLKLLETEFQKQQIATHILTGETKERQAVVQAFQNDPNAAVFLLSLRAAGTGLNLTTASYVVLYDPWWNPAVEAQAIDRSHRIGQTQNVTAFRLIAPGTVEEKIWDLQQSKSQTIADVLGEEGFARSLSQTDLEYLFSED